MCFELVIRDNINKTEYIPPQFLFTLQIQLLYLHYWDIILFLFFMNSDNNLYKSSKRGLYNSLNQNESP